jgi:thymidine kinase
MFSGKTEELIRLVRRAMHARRTVQVFKSSLETRCDEAIVQTHDGSHLEALPVSTSAQLEAQLLPEVDVVGIEEVQFFDEGVLPLCERLADRGIFVIAAGLDQDFRGEPFGFMPTLLARADHVTKLNAICKKCGGEASRTQRLIDGLPARWDDPVILIGASESYEARCRKCHEVRGKPRASKRTPREKLLLNDAAEESAERSLFE